MGENLRRIRVGYKGIVQLFFPVLLFPHLFPIFNLLLSTTTEQQAQLTGRDVETSSHPLQPHCTPSAPKVSYFTYIKNEERMAGWKWELKIIFGVKIALSALAENMYSYPSSAEACGTKSGSSIHLGVDWVSVISISLIVGNAGL